LPDWEAVIAKFRECAAFSGICPPEQAEQLVQAVRALERARDVRPLLKAAPVLQEEKAAK
jgi:hypothetical protein